MMSNSFALPRVFVFILFSTTKFAEGGVPAELKIYSEVVAYPNEDSLIVSTRHSISDLAPYSPPTDAPVALCSNGSWLVYPAIDYTGEPMMLGLISVPFCLFSGQMVVNSVQTVGNTVDNETPALTLFPSSDYNGVASTIGGDWGNIYYDFVSFIVTGYHPENLNELIMFYDEFNLSGNSTCVIRRSFSRDINEFGLEHGGVKSFKYGC